MSVEGVNATALRSLRCDSALMSALQRLSERDIDHARRRAQLARINSGTDTLGFSTIRSCGSFCHSAAWDSVGAASPSSRWPLP